MILCIYLPFYYALKYKGVDTLQLPSASTLYVGNAVGLAWKYVQLLFPFLVIFPYSMSFFEESKAGMLMYVQVRNGRKQYYYSQLITCFIGGFIIICIPFLVNILLNSIIFPESGNDYISTYNQFTWNWRATITGSNVVFPVLYKGFILKNLFVNHPQLYNVLFAILSGFTAGIMSMLAYAFSMFIKKSRLFIFLMMYILFQAFAMLDSVLVDRWDETTIYVRTNIVEYISNGLLQPGKVYWLFWGLLLIIFFIATRIVRGRIAEDEI
jgi:hypothetical protein